ncbi:hypothetical protein M5X06_22195 [Paenibacillus alvei]|uniref:Uncharacterized protein n=1 Tax=Paenibacillus alvei TaxID=44250 RepID=A0ABT4H2K3_PAEAL|nr:hypothetical protein [Paenibacillus alvei]MCY9763210.1 hypothetical protein [Paenibacillus alvei]MCY9769501.1 hypothetical protein [Paenibacillus alvei]
MKKLEKHIDELNSHIAEISGLNSDQQNSALKHLLESLNALYKVGNVNEATINISLAAAVKRGDFDKENIVNLPDLQNKSVENIHSPVIVVDSKSAEGDDCYTINFGGTVSQIDHIKPTEDQLYWFKKGILAERERIWDEGHEIEEDKLRKLIRQGD